MAGCVDFLKAAGVMPFSGASTPDRPCILHGVTVRVGVGGLIRGIRPDGTERSATKWNDFIFSFLCFGA